MRDFQETPDYGEKKYSLFLIQKIDQLNYEVFESLLKALSDSIASFELIQKGHSFAVVGYFPLTIQSIFPGLGLVEIEDYLAEQDSSQTEEYLLSRQIQLNDSFAWLLQPKNKKHPKLEKNNSVQLELENDQYCAWQIVCEVVGEKVQVTPRIIIKESDVQKKIELIKKIKQEITDKSSLVSTSSLLHHKSFEDYKKRSLIPKSADAFLIGKPELFNFIKQSGV